MTSDQIPTREANDAKLKELFNEIIKQVRGIEDGERGTVAIIRIDKDGVANTACFTGDDLATILAGVGVLVETLTSNTRAVQ